MKFHKQRFLSDKANGIFVDCMRTAIACILDLEMDDVPHFLEGGVNYSVFMKEFMSF